MVEAGILSDRERRSVRIDEVLSPRVADARSAEAPAPVQG
jgi:hypothetical protein